MTASRTIARYIFLLLCASACAQKWTVDVPREPPSDDYQPYRSVDLHFIDADTILVGFDWLGHCDHDSASNKYTAFVINASNGTIETRREFHALPRSLRLISTKNNGPLLISQHSIQVLDKNTLETQQTIPLPYKKTRDPDAVSKLAKLPCYTIPLRVSSTPDTSRIEVVVEPPDHSIMFVIDGSNLQIQTMEWPKRIWDFAIGYKGQFFQTSIGTWSWTGGPGRVDERSVCDECGHLDVVSPDNIMVYRGRDVLVMRGDGELVWHTPASGVRDAFGANYSGKRFALLFSKGGGLLQPPPYFTPIVFDVEKKRVIKLKSIPIKGNDSLGDAVAISDDGNRVAVFTRGRLALYELGDQGKSAP